MIAKGFLVGCLSVVLACAPMSSAGTTSAVGQMQTKGTAEINGTPASPESTIFAGDRISTEKDTTVYLALSGGEQVLLPGESKALLRRADSQVTIRLERGALAVVGNASTSVVVEANGARIRASQAGSIFEVAIHDRRLEVFARKGAALVEAADRTVAVPEGKRLDATMSPSAQQGVAPASGSFETFMLLTGVAAGIAGLAMGIAAITRPNPNDCKAVSPSGQVTCP
jgi:hypothetical protein